MMRVLFVVVHVVLLAACDRSSEPRAMKSAGSAQPAPPAGSGSAPVTAPSDVWITGSVDERFATVAKHLRGFDVAMVEIGYRYGELYWAGQDKNWQYAGYQLDKIELAIAQGIERRPKRAASAAMLAPAIATLRDAVKSSDGAKFTGAFSTLTQTCNTCHVAEKVAFIPIAPPKLRASPVGR